MDLDQLLDPAQSNRRVPCHARLAIEALSDEDRAKVVAALDNPRVYATKIAEWLNAKGAAVETQSVQRHRRRGCKCPP